MKWFLYIGIGIVIISVFVLYLPAFDRPPAPPELRVAPQAVLQGEPAMVRALNIPEANPLQSISFNGKELPVFTFEDEPAAFIAIELRGKTGEFPIVARLQDGSELSGTLAVAVRPKVEAPLGIPQKLGGNTAASQAKLVSTLEQENEEIRKTPTADTSFWNKKFKYPVKEPVITDAYGYTRKTGAYTIPHLGTDLRGDETTKVFAMNRGVVRVAKEYRNYGKTVILDHGQGVHTLYMHMSELRVAEGDIVDRGQELGRAGKTGYADKPHLHVSVKINTVSIDPVRFIALFD